MKQIFSFVEGFAVEITDIDVKLTTDKGTFSFGVDNDGSPYISTDVRNIIISPCAANRVRVFEEGKK